MAKGLLTKGPGIVRDICARAIQSAFPWFRATDPGIAVNQRPDQIQLQFLNDLAAKYGKGTLLGIAFSVGNVLQRYPTQQGSLFDDDGEYA